MTKDWLDRVAQRALSYRETLEATYDIARSALERGIPGDFVECGVFQGAQCAVMARAILDLQYRDQRRVHLFDSFQGLPPAAPIDQEIYAHWGDKATDPGAICSLAQVQANMRAWGIPDELLDYHPGWFSATVPGAQFPNGIAVLRLDGDLYGSTKVCMEHLHPLLSRGGWVIVDDWNLSGTRKAVEEFVVPAPIYWRIPTK